MFNFSESKCVIWCKISRSILSDPLLFKETLEFLLCDDDLNLHAPTEDINDQADNW
jgi:hypothetical protein